MTRRGNNAPQQGNKAHDNRRGRNNNQHTGQQQQQQEPLVSVFHSRSAFILEENPTSPFTTTYVRKKGHDKKDFKTNFRGGGGSQFNLFRYQNDRVDNPRELNNNGMESNPPRSSSPNRGRGRGKSGDRGGGGSGRGRGNPESRGRGRGYQGWNDDGRGRNDTRNDARNETSGNGSLAALPAGNETDKEFEENVRDLTSNGASRLARFSNNTSEQASYDELKVARQRERRDLIAKGLIDDPDNRSTLANAVKFVGTCMDMCPLFERTERAAQFNVDKWELNPRTGKIDKNFAVKKFHRPAAGADAPLPSDVRPPRVLVTTLDYLVDSFLNSDEQLKLTHGFLRDRTRSIRQDFTMQSYTGSEAVACHEIIARLHIISLHKLADEPITKFVPQQEMEQLQKVLTTLQQLYDDARSVGIAYPNEPEFRAYQLIIHLRDQDQERQAQRWPPDLFDSRPVQQALKFFELAQRNNGEAVHLRLGNTESCMNFFGTLFRLVKSKTTSYLQACLLEFHFNDIRKTALKAIKNTYRVETKLVFLKDIKEMLGYESEEFVIRDCQHYGLGVAQTEVDGNMFWYLVIEKGGKSWNENAPAPKVNFHSSVEKKIGNRTIADVCYGIICERISAKSSQAAVVSTAGSATFGKPPTSTLQAVPVSSSVFAKPASSNKAPVAQEVASAFTTRSHQSFPATVPPVISQQSQNVFQKGMNAPAQAMNVFQKAAANIPNQPNVFQKALQSARSSTPPLVSAFGPTSQASGAAPPVSAFAPVNGTLNPATNVFKPVAVTAEPSEFFTPITTTTTSFSVTTQPLAPQQGSTKVPTGGFFAPRASSPSTVSTSPRSAFELGAGASKVASGGFFQPRAASSSPQSVFKVPQPQVASGGLFQSQKSSVVSPGLDIQPVSLQKSFQPTSTSSSTSQSVFEQAPKTSPAGLFQSNASSSSLPPFSTPSNSLFQSQPAGPATTTNSLSSGSVFESHSVQKQFPVDFFSVPSGTPNDYEEENDNNAYSVPTPIQTGASNSLFDRISTPPVQNASTQQNMDTPSFISASLFSPSVVPAGSFTAPISFTPSASVTAPAPSISHQLVPTKKPLLSRSAVWDFANSIFEDILGEEVTRTVQGVIDEDKARAVDTIAAEKYVESEKLVARELALDVAAEQFYAMRSGARIFYSWKARGRRLMMKRRGEERRRNPPTLAPIQWRPVKVPETAFDGPYDEIQHMNYLTYKPVPLKEIFQPKVEAAFWPTGEGDRKWRLLLNSSNGKEDFNNYWWIEKMVGNGQPRISMSKKGTFEAQFKLSDANAEAREIGGFVFGCSADYSISNEERFAQDRQNLHAAVNWLSDITEFKKLAVMVVCYRSPLDNEDADPYGRDMGRTSGPGRRGRVAAIRQALDLDAFGEKVIGRDVVLIENLNDCNLEPAMRKFADLVLPTVNPKVAEMMSRAPSPDTIEKQNSAKRKRAAYQQQLSVGSPKPVRSPKPVPQTMPTTPGSESKPKRQRVRNAVHNVGMQTKYFTLKARGLHVDWNKFPMPGGGTLGDGVENPVAEEYILTTTPVTTPERRPDVESRRQSPLEGLKDDLADLQRMMGEVSSLLDSNTADLYDMKEELNGVIAEGW